MLDALDLSRIQDESTRQCILLLLNLMEELKQENQALREDNQRLRDEINRLKGEHGKPPTKPNPPPPDRSSEQERRVPRDRMKRAKHAKLTIHREQFLPLDPATLPSDVEFKGYEDVIVQDIVIQPENICFHKEKYYAPSTGQTYLAPLPTGYGGQFGPGIKALTLVLYYACQMSEPKILEFFQHVGVQISEGTISNLLVKDQAPFHAEQDAAYLAGLRSSPWQHLDDTATRVNGQNQHCHIVCNPLHTTYRTTPAKDRLTIIDVLSNGQPRSFLLDDDALAYLDAVGLAQVRRQQVLSLPREQRLDEPTLLRLLEEHLPGLGVQPRKWILEALAVSAYHAQAEVPVVRLLVCDDAPQFHWVTDDLALCWVHEGRHYKKLTPCVALHQQHLDNFLKQFWGYYHDLRRYQEQPTAVERARLETAFESLFATCTGYWALDQRIALTRAKKAQLLQVLAHPEIPLHNNPAELGARQRVRKRDVSFGPRTAEGSKAWDTFMSLAATTKKLRVSFYHYIHDRISGANQVPQLADIVTQRAQELSFGASWSTV